MTSPTGGKGMKTKTEFVPGKPSTAQADYLADAVGRAYQAGWKGSLRERTAPMIARWASRPTRVSLRAKGLLEMTDGARARGSLLLTKHGVEAGEAAYEETRGGTAKEGADKAIRLRQEREQAEQDRKDRIKHLFRGLYLKRQAGYGAKSKKGRSVAAHVEHSSSIQMHVEDLLELGEGIEKLR